MVLRSYQTKYEDVFGEERVTIERIRVEGILLNPLRMKLRGASLIGYSL